jgi:excisionase family DNA binding protein
MKALKDSKSANTTASDTSADEWVTLQEASDLLGMATSTVRRWADAGRVPVKRTLGGHRRFSRAAILHLAQTLPDGAATQPAAGVEDDEREIESREWHLRLATRPASQRMRELGQRLLGVLIQYVKRRDEEERFLDEARAVGMNYGAEARAAGVSMYDTVEAFLLFRNVHAHYAVPLPPVTHASDMAEWMDIHGRVDRFMDTLLLGVVAGHERGDGSDSRMP